MSLLHSLGAADRLLFQKINQAWANPLFDLLMPAVTDLDKSVWIVWFFLPLFLAGWLFRQRGRAAKTLLALTLVVGLTDTLCYRVIKPLVRRPRPERSGAIVLLRDGSHGAYGFPSNHAANTFAVAAFLAPLYPGLKVPLFAAAAVVAYSRVYVGAHFPLDVLGGAVLGLLIGWLANAAFRRLVKLDPGRVGA